MSDSLVFLIPAYQPCEMLLSLVQQLRDLTPHPILVINDGSHPEKKSLFEKLEMVQDVRVFTHGTNLGKGAALKSGFNFILVYYPKAVGVVTLDADGQHYAYDALRVGEALSLSPDSLVLGCRKFDANHRIPVRSLFGNMLTKKVFSAVTGVVVSDTQTGLRGIPVRMLPQLMRLALTGYDFETEMLLLATKFKIRVREVPISTVYIKGNASSHFNPLWDSLRIYFVFIRFAATSMVTALIDLIAFGVTHWITGNILSSSVMGRLFAGSFNFYVVRNAVFRSRGRLNVELFRYILLVSFFLFLSNSAISALVRRLEMNVYIAKLIVESSLFLLSFVAQRVYIFKPREHRYLEPLSELDGINHSMPSEPNGVFSRRDAPPGIASLQRIFRRTIRNPSKTVRLFSR